MVNSLREHSLTEAGATKGFPRQQTRIRALRGGRDFPSSDGRPLANEDLASRIQAVIKARVERFNYFPQALFADPAWDILLELALAEQQQRRVTITQLCNEAHVPATTAARWIRHLTEEGWLIRRDCTLDARVKYIELSREASAKMRCYFLQLTDLRGV